MTLTLRSLAIPHPWQAWVIAAEAPAEAPPSPEVAAFFEHLTQAVEEAFALGREVFVHAWKLHQGGLSDLLHDNLAAWQPEMGLGIWPDRDPPGLWTQERFMDASAAGIEGNEPDLPAYRLLRLDGSVTARRGAALALWGREALTQFFLTGSYAQLEAQTRAVFFPGIRTRVYQHERFYMPLLDAHSLTSLRTAEQLETWLGQARVYLRESAEDRGWLLVSVLPVQTLLDTLARQMGLTLVMLTT